MLINCFKHADASKIHPVQIDAKLHGNHLSFSVLDMGEGFHQQNYNINNFDKSEENLYRENGRGLFLASAMSSMLKFNRKGNKVLARIDL